MCSQGSHFSGGSGNLSLLTECSGDETGWGLEGTQRGGWGASHGSPQQVGAPAGLGSGALAPRVGRPNSALGWRRPGPAPSLTPCFGPRLEALRWLASWCSEISACSVPPLLQSLPCNLSPTVWSPNTSSDFQRSFTDYKLRSNTLSLRITIPPKAGSTRPYCGGASGGSELPWDSSVQRPELSSVQLTVKLLGAPGGLGPHARCPGAGDKRHLCREERCL